ncbi:MAG: type IV toxin-antitoxin system AbiEi family antitoxin domain-containing protein [Micrococcaceae bacterium]
MIEHSQISKLTNCLIHPGCPNDLGWSYISVHRALKAGKLYRIWPGFYIKQSIFELLTINEKHLLRILAARKAVTEKLILSHTSAARIHNFAVLDSENHVSFRTTNLRAKSKSLKYHRYQDEAEVIKTDIGLITTPEQTVIDCARKLPFINALVTADSARNKGCLISNILDVLDKNGFKKDKSKVQKILNFSTKLAESPAETIARFQLYKIGMPKPTLQKTLYYEGYKFRADISYPELSLIVEVDGKQKYFDFNNDIKTAIYKEKLRQDVIERNGWKIIRLTWQDLQNLYLLKQIFRPYLTQHTEDLIITNGV